MVEDLSVIVELKKQNDVAKLNSLRIYYSLICILYIYLFVYAGKLHYSLEKVFVESEDEEIFYYTFSF